ncbi:MAG: hypothetical protein HKP61_16650 [Dactylosporangium sp.]|nr:hypothetical protein [Dactylosporangium sp.]NNJ62537.1 hypothetical protein [Dactylosporangium sp.]
MIKRFELTDAGWVLLATDARCRPATIKIWLRDLTRQQRSTRRTPAVATVP